MRAANNPTKDRRLSIRAQLESRQANGVVRPLETATSICRKRFTICSGMCFFALRAGLDHWLYHSIFSAGKRIYVVGGLRVRHRLSLANRVQLGPKRFDNILAAEAAFCDLYANRFARWHFSVWLTDLCKGLLRRSNRNLNQVTWKHLKQRFFASRNSRE
jgi:hypothetical protein